MTPTEFALVGAAYIAAMPAMLPFFGGDELADPDTDEPAGEAREYGIGAVIMMLFWLPMMVLTGLFVAANFVATVADRPRDKPKRTKAEAEYLANIW